MTADRPVFAAGLLMASMFLMSFVDNLVRVVSDDLTVWQFHLIRALFALPMIAVAARFFDGATLRQRAPRWVCLRAVVMAVSMLLFFGSIPMMPMAQATAGLFTAPLFVLTFTALFLNEPVGWRRILAVLVGFAGVLVILQPFRSDLDWRSLLPVLAGAFYAVCVIITRQRCREESPFALIFANFAAFGLMGAAGAVVLTLFPLEGERFIFGGWTTPDPSVLAVMAGLALAAVIGVGGLTRAYQLAESSFLTLFDYTHLLGACLFAYLLWSEVPPPEAVAGVVMIVGAGIYLTLRGQHRAAASADGKRISA